MVAKILVLAGLFPFDPSIDTPLGHRNLILVYVAVWGLHLAYLLYALLQWKALSQRSSKE